MKMGLKRGFYAIQRSMARCLPLAPRRDSVVIFNLHTVAPACSEMAIKPATLRAGLEGLLAAGFECLELSKAMAALNGSLPLRAPSFVLTFDDGYSSVLEAGLPILAQLDLRATVFVTTGFLDGSIAPPWRSRDPALLEEYHRERAAFLPLSWAQLEALCASGRVDIGCHSVSHPRLGTLSPDEVRDEAGHAREQLEVRLGRSVEHFAYPFGVARYGAYSDTTELVLQQLGFKSSCTSEIGRAACGGGTWLLRRMPLTDEDLPRDVLAKATGAYDWVGWAQQVYQRVFPNPH